MMVTASRFWNDCFKIKGIVCGAVLAALIGCTHTSQAQDNYEIQVYGSDTVKPGHTMLELHSNYTFNGSTTKQDGVLPTQHQLHETLEITHGYTDTFETGFYLFTSAQQHQGWDFVGMHVRPRWRVPESAKWPVGFSLSTEFGYQRRAFSTDDWTLEIRPIVDKQIGRWYLAVNPALEQSFKGLNAPRGLQFSPAVKISYDVTPKVTLGMEYYGSTGPMFQWDRLADQQHQICPSIDLNFGQEWEFNFGVVMGLTHSTDNLLVKMIIGRRFNF
jgi:hypothetical protein